MHRLLMSVVLAKRFFAVQAELAAAVVNAIVPTAKGSPIEEPMAPTTDLNAYDEVARRMDMPVGSIGPTRARCLGKLRRLVA